MLVKTRYATCTSEGCENWGEPIPVATEESHLIFCGPCSNQVTDITDIKPTEGTALPQWILDQLAMQNSDN